MNYYSYLIFIINILACNSSDGKPGMSESMNESKKRKVFICEYLPVRNLIIINDTLKINIDNVWLEKKWAYNSNTLKTIIREGYQLIVHTSEKLDEDYSFDWTIGISFKRSFRSCGFSCIVSDFDSLPNKTETWKIQQGRSLYDGTNHKIIGVFTLNRKP